MKPIVEMIPARSKQDPPDIAHGRMRISTTCLGRMAQESEGSGKFLGKKARRGIAFLPPPRVDISDLLFSLWGDEDAYRQRRARSSEIN